MYDHLSPECHQQVKVPWTPELYPAYIFADAEDIVIIPLGQEENTEVVRLV